MTGRRGAGPAAPAADATAGRGFGLHQQLRGVPRRHPRAPVAAGSVELRRAASVLVRDVELAVADAVRHRRHDARPPAAGSAPRAPRPDPWASRARGRHGGAARGSARSADGRGRRCRRRSRAAPRPGSCRCRGRSTAAAPAEMSRARWAETITSSNRLGTRRTQSSTVIRAMKAILRGVEPLRLVPVYPMFADPGKRHAGDLRRATARVAPPDGAVDGRRQGAQLRSPTSLTAAMPVQMACPAPNHGCDPA